MNKPLPQNHSNQKRDRDEAQSNSPLPSVLRASRSANPSILAPLQLISGHLPHPLAAPAEVGVTVVQISSQRLIPLPTVVQPQTIRFIVYHLPLLNCKVSQNMHRDPHLLTYLIFQDPPTARNVQFSVPHCRIQARPGPSGHLIEPPKEAPHSSQVMWCHARGLCFRRSSNGQGTLNSTIAICTT